MIARQGERDADMGQKTVITLRFSGVFGADG